ncbi:MAG: GFA family protein [Sandaracinaceae bacterium]
MHLRGSCHCQRVVFEVDCDCPVPFLHCYCSICRKTSGGAGCLVNLGGSYASLTILRGEGDVRAYRARVDAEDGAPGRPSEHRRYFCTYCGSHLWAWNAEWPDLVHPVAAAIDTPLPEPPSRAHMMVRSAPPWARPSSGPGDSTHDGYPPFSLRSWHEARGLLSPSDDG